MTTLSARLFDLFRNLKTDAVPRPMPPRPYAPDEPPAENNENNYNATSRPSSQDDGPAVILIEEPDDDLKKKKKSKTKKPFSDNKEEQPKKQEKQKSDCTVNTQATGNVINIVNSKDVRWGDDYYMGPTAANPKQNAEPKEEEVEKCKMIITLMEAKIKPEHEYLDCISNNLGKNWHGLFISLGYLKGRIETMELNTREYGVTEARYKLLLDWVRNDEDGSLGKLSTKLWEHRDRALVKKLATIYTDKNAHK